MSGTVDFLHESRVFYLATVDGAQAQVRPINSVIAYQGKICFATSNQQLEAAHRRARGFAGVFSFAHANEPASIKQPNGFALPERLSWMRVNSPGQAMLDAIPALKDVYTFQVTAD